MPNIAHSTLTGSELHEPKGVASATEEQVYRADGAGSGDWKKIYTQGWEDWNDSGSSQSLTSGSYVDLTNNGAGSYTKSTYRLPGYSAIWDTTNNQFDWDAAGLVLGDTVDIRIAATVTTANANDVTRIRLDMAEGHANAYSINVCEHIFKTAGTYNIAVTTSIYMGNTETLTYPAKLAMYTDGAGNSVVVDGWYVRVIPLNPVYGT